MKKIVMGVVAHVDSGKTTLTEALLELTGAVRKTGRVDKGDSVLDTDQVERSRGITVFSKQAVLNTDNMQLCLLDTPGHVDFGRETERTLSVLDCAVLIISATDGVQSHTETLWQLLKNYNVPVFVFVNKMDLDSADKEKVLNSLKTRFGDGFIDFNLGKDKTDEAVAMQSEMLMEEFLENGSLSMSDITKAIFQRKVFPCFFGSALKRQGLDEFLNGIENFTPDIDYPEKFGAKVFKIFREDNERLTFLKVTGGSLKVRDTVTYKTKDGSLKHEKVTGIRVYSGGDKFTYENEAAAGDVCAISGLTLTYPGRGIGFERDDDTALLQSVFTYKVLFNEDTDQRTVLSNLRIMGDEEPGLKVEWNEASKEIRVSLMGKIQMEVVKTLYFNRFGSEISFDRGAVLYKETIKNTVEGVGHFEPLRHYAEVHLLLEPLPQGSGLVFDSVCSEDMLDRNWQRLILTHLGEKEHVGVLTGSPVTDMKITLVKGRAHIKHTEGGDFREATYRAVRNGLMQAESVLLEPWFDFEITVPTQSTGRVMADIQRMSGMFNPGQPDGEYTVITGQAPVFEINSYNLDLMDFTHGRGRISLKFAGYKPCHNRRQIIEESGYIAERDIENTADSVFCTHGAGVIVKWNEVKNKMHLDRFLKPDRAGRERAVSVTARAQAERFVSALEDDKELLAIFERTYGKIKTDRYTALKTAPTEKATKSGKDTTYDREFLLVDGYNIIFAWDNLKKIALEDIDHARNTLADILANYRGFKRCDVILVFDAYRVKGSTGSIMKYHNIHIVYTKEAETADMYIEKVTHEIGRRYKVRVATSDGLEQIIILGHGAMRVSASAFLEEVTEAEKAIREYLE